jgi:uncharacterized membrane protein
MDTRQSTALEFSKEVSWQAGVFYVVILLVKVVTTPYRKNNTRKVNIYEK